MEVIATSHEWGYVSMEQVSRPSTLQIKKFRLIVARQHYYGTSTDGHDFDFKFRYNGFLHKKDGIWKWIQEHVSFPANIATRQADFTCNQDAGEHLMMKNDDNVKRDAVTGSVKSGASHS